MKGRCSTCGAPVTLLDVSCRYCRTAVTAERTDRVVSTSHAEGLRSGFITVNEARRDAGLPVGPNPGKRAQR